MSDYVVAFNELLKTVKGITRVVALTDNEVMMLAGMLEKVVSSMPPEMRERVIISFPTRFKVKYKDLPKEFIENEEFRAQFLMALRQYADAVM